MCIEKYLIYKPYAIAIVSMQCIIVNKIQFFVSILIYNIPVIFIHVPVVLLFFTYLECFFLYLKFTMAFLFYCSVFGCRHVDECGTDTRRVLTLLVLIVMNVRGIWNILLNTIGLSYNIHGLGCELVFT